MQSAMQAIVRSELTSDTLGRPLRNLRLSVTDRCNLRCEYCMPEDDYVWLPREDVLHFEEISALVDRVPRARRQRGAADRRRTAAPPRSAGARPHARGASPGLADLALTTNGVLLAEQIDALKPPASAGSPSASTRSRPIASSR